MLEQFIEYKHKSLYARSLDKFKALRQPISKFFGMKLAAAVDEDAADKFRLFLAQKIVPSTQRERLTILNACWKWAIKQKLVTENPWAEVLRRVRVLPVQKPRPFTQREIQAILIGMKSDRHYAHYAKFCLSTMQQTFRADYNCLTLSANHYRGYLGYLGYLVAGSRSAPIQRRGAIDLS